MDDIIIKSVFSQAFIDQLIKDEVEESLHLDYKESASLAKNDLKKKDISKDVSAFANSDGGLIIYGIEEKNHKPTNLSFVNGNEFTKEWLEQIIQSSIYKKIEGIQITPIRYNNDITKSIYVVKIPNDSAVPHMAIDNRYYRRYNFNSVPMEEYEVRNLYFKFEKTNLKIASHIVNISPSSIQGLQLISLNLNMTFHIDNIGNTIEKLYKLEIYLPRLLYILSYSPSFNPLYEFLIRQETDYSVFSFPNKSPLFQNERATVIIPNLVITSKSFLSAQTQKIKIKLYFTGGIEELEIDLNPLLVYKGKSLTLSDLKVQ